MKKSLLAIAPLFIAFSAFSQPILSLQQEFIAEVLNGVPAAISTDNEVQLKPGQNQLAVTIGQIVFENGKRRKFDSELLVMTFDVSEDESLSLNYKTFRTIDDAKAFTANPDMQLTNAAGEKVDFEVVQLRKNGLQGFRDYEREIADYNSENGYKHQSVLSVKGVPVEKDLKQSFSEMSRIEQQAFMQWAMQNLK